MQVDESLFGPPISGAAIVSPSLVNSHDHEGVDIALNLDCKQNKLVND
jgi:hypothetical protein